MAKVSLIAREVKRKKIVDKYATKRAALKLAGDYVALSRLPRNASRTKTSVRKASTK